MDRDDERCALAVEAVQAFLAQVLVNYLILYVFLIFNTMKKASGARWRWRRSKPALAQVPFFVLLFLCAVLLVVCMLDNVFVCSSQNNFNDLI